MKVILLSKLRKQFPDIQLDIVATVKGNLDELCARVGSKPQLKRYKGSGGEVFQFKSICFQLTTGAIASLTQEERRLSTTGTISVSDNFEITYPSDQKAVEERHWPNVVDIELQINANYIVYEEDLVEVVTELGIELERVERFENNKWRSHRRKA